jgi:uncharacterized protein YjiK
LLLLNPVFFPEILSLTINPLRIRFFSPHIKKINFFMYSNNKCQSGHSKVLLRLIIFFMFAFGTSILAQEPYQRLVQKFETPELGIPNPAGLVFSPAAEALLVTPSPGIADLVTISFTRHRVDSVTMATIIPRPVNMAFDGKFNCLLFFDDNLDELVEIEAGVNGRPKTSSQAITRYNALPFNVKKARGMTFDPNTGDLFFLVVPAPSAIPRIVRLIPDPHARFNNPAVSSILLNSLQGSQLGGIAFNPSDGHLYLMSPTEQKLYEVNQNGDVLTTRDLSPFELKNAQNMVFAPSGDQTDDPAIMSLYIADSGPSSIQGPALSPSQGVGDIAELSLAPPEQVTITALAASFNLIQSIPTSLWSPPSPDPSGLAYIPASNHLLLTDGEVNEMGIYAGVNAWEFTLTDSQIYTFNTTAYSDEPNGVAYNPNNRHIYSTDDTGTRSIYELDPGPDSLYGTLDDIVTSIATGAFGSGDPEGIAYDTFQGHLFMVDGVNVELYDIDPGLNGLFDGVPPSGDDIVTNYDVSILGIQDPEGVEFNSDNGNLYILGSNDLIVETTRDVTYIQEYDLSSIQSWQSMMCKWWKATAE